MKATESTKAAHELLDAFANDLVVKGYAEALRAMQVKSEEEGWWNAELGLAIEDAWGHLKIAMERAARR